MNRLVISHPFHMEVASTSEAETAIPSSASPVLTSGVLDLYGKHYDLRGIQGLASYTVYDPSRTIAGITYAPFFAQGNFIVYDPANPDIYKLLGSICMMIQYGHEDSSLTSTQMKAAMLRRRLRVQCGGAVVVAETILSDLGIPWRECHLVTGERPTNFDDGHVALEVYINGGWRFVDIACDSYFTDPGTGRHLCLREIVLRGVNNCNHERLAPTELSAGDPIPNTIISPTQQACKYTARPWSDIVCGSDALYLEWARRVWQLPGIADPATGITYWYIPEGLEDRATWLASLSGSWTILTEAAWRTRFPDA